MKIKKAVILAGGIGSRMAPASKVLAKEMLPIVDRPAMDYLVDDLISAGVKEVLVVAHKDKTSIQKYFTNAKISFSYIYPDVPLGVADALLHAENFVSGKPFYLLYGDVLFSAKPNSLEQMKKVFDEAKCSVVATRKVKQSKTNLYGCLSLKEAKGQKYITSIVEKPHPKVAPSNIVIAGQFLLTSKIFKYLKNLTAGQLFTDALLCLAKNNNLAIAEIEGKCFDIGNKAGYVLATLHYAQSHSQIKKEIKSFLYSFNKNNAKK